MNTPFSGGASAPQLLITVREAAQRLALSERTVFSLTAAGDLPAVRIGRAVRYSVATLERFIAARHEVQR